MTTASNPEALPSLARLAAPLVLLAIALIGCDREPTESAAFRVDAYECPPGCVCTCEPIGGSDESSSEGGTSSADGDALAELSDEFDGDLSAWTPFQPASANRIEIVDGALELEPAAMSAWYNESVSAQVGKAVQGDFRVTTHIQVTAVDGSPVYPGWDWRLAGINMRAADGLSDAFHVALGQTNQQGLRWEAKTTDDNVSQYFEDNWAEGEADLRLCRVGQTLTAFVSDGDAWVEVLSVDRPDMTGDVFVGPVSYAWADPPNVLARYDAVTFEAVTSQAGCSD